MVDNPEPDGPWFSDQSAYPGLHRNYGCKELSVGTYVWRIEPYQTLDQIKNQSYRFYWHDTGQSMAS